MILPRKAVMGDCGAYIGAITERQAIKPTAIKPNATDLDRRSDCGVPQRLSLTRFHNDEPCLKQASRRHSDSDG
jgi:hypothetical protein